MLSGQSLQLAGTDAENEGLAVDTAVSKLSFSVTFRACVCVCFVFVCKREPDRDIVVMSQWYKVHRNIQSLPVWVY